MDENKVLVNPRLLEVGYKKDRLPFRSKVYRPVVGRLAHGIFRTATEAQSRAVAVFVRWCRLYDAAVLEMTSSSPVAAEEEQVVEAEG